MQPSQDVQDGNADRSTAQETGTDEGVIPPAQLRGAALKGGAFLAGRHGLSLVIHLLGVTLLTRAVGPHDYGLYVGALGVHTYVYAMSQLGLVVFLVRHGGKIGNAEFDQAFTLLAVIGVALAAAIFTTLPTVEGWIGIEEFARVGQALIIVLPIQLLALVPMGRMERTLNYRAIASAELGGYIVFYIVALPLARVGFGEWAPVAGYWSQQGLVAIAMYGVSRYRPRLRWDPPLISQMVTYGVRYSGALWIWQLRDVLNPVIVGRFAGPTAVAFVALTIRLVDALSFLKGVGWRVSLAVLGQIQNDPKRMIRAAGDGMRLQALTLGVVLAGFGLVSHWAVPRLFGLEWILVTAIYPFVAVAYLANAVFQFEIVMLNVVGLTRQVAEFHLLYLVLFAATAIVLVPRAGPVGYAWSEMVALPTYIVLHLQTSRLIGRPAWMLAGLWSLAFVSLLFWQHIGWVSVVVPVAAILWPDTLRQLRTYLKYLGNVGRLRYVE
jgi:PST family polysaccharide transporter